VTVLWVYRFCQHLNIFQSSYNQTKSSAKARLKQRRLTVREPDVPDVDLDVQMWDELPDDQLGVADDLGWAPIHHAAQKGVLRIVERAVAYNNQLLEQKTVDVAAITPLLIAVQVNSSSSSLSSSSSTPHHT